MNRVKTLYLFTITVILFSSFNFVYAQSEEPIDAEPILPKVVISEIQTNGEGTGTSGEEFIELYNFGEEVINLIDYKLIYVTSTGTESDLYIFTEPLLLLPDTFALGKLAASPADFLQDIEADFVYTKGSSGIAATAGGLKLVDSDFNIIDEAYWTSSASSEIPAVLSLEGGKSAQRYCLDDVLVTDDNHDFTKEFIVDAPTPKELICNISPIEEPPITPPDEAEEEPTSQTTEQETEAPVANPKIMINELFIDPVSPQLDSEDEFVELFNPNAQELDISEYKIVAGLNTKYTYTLPEGTKIGPNSYRTFYSKDGNLTLSNSGGQVVLIDNLGTHIDDVVYNNAEAGESWSLNSGQWAWTTTVTPNAANIITQPVKIVKASATSTKTTSKTSSKSSGKTNFTNAPPITINEVFPDPTSPQKDSSDEFIELYNPYDYEINIADYTITSGVTKVYKHVIKAPAFIAAKGFYTVTSADTKLSLTNGGGKVSLINNFDKQIDSVEYPEAIPGSSWALIDGKWQWTSSPTKNSANLLTGLIDGLANNKDDSKTTQIAGATVSGTDNTPLVAAPQPLPGWLLAVLGLAAICYAAYEYRFEAKNYYYKYQRLRSLRS